MSKTEGASSLKETTIKYVCGIELGSQSCSGCVIRPDKSLLVKPIEFANTQEGLQVWKEKLSQLDAFPDQILIGMEGTSLYSENIYHELELHGYVLRLLHKRQSYQFRDHKQLRIEEDRLDAMTIAKILLSVEAQVGYVAQEGVSSYWVLVRLQNQLSEEATAYQKEIHGLIVDLFPEFIQIFPDPFLPSALEVLQAYPSASQIATAGEEAIVHILDASAQPPTDYDRIRIQKLVELTRRTVSSGRTVDGQSLRLRILCDQLE